MTTLDLAVFLIAGIIGAFGAYRADRFPWGGALAWCVVGVWALLKLLRVLA